MAKKKKRRPEQDSMFRFGRCQSCLAVLPAPNWCPLCLECYQEAGRR